MAEFAKAHLLQQPFAKGIEVALFAHCAHPADSVGDVGEKYFVGFLQVGSGEAAAHAVGPGTRAAFIDIPE